MGGALENQKTFVERHTPTWVSERLAQARRAGWQSFFNRERTKNFVAHVNDCADDDSRTRLVGRSSEILGQYGGFTNVTSDLEGSAGIITAYDALNGAGAIHKKNHRNVILANIAPREGKGKLHENGSPFCYFWDRDKKTLVVSTVDGLALSLVKKFNLTDAIYVLDTRETLGILKKSGMITESEEARIGETQFRSFEFSPRVATYLLRYGTIRGATKIPIAEIPDAPGAVYFIDKFEKYGNCKTTLVAEDVFPKDIAEKLASGTISSSEQITTLNTRFGALPVYRRLKDVPEGVLAVIVGSSGLGHQRFLEIVVQGGSAQNQLGLSAGDSLY